MDEKTVMDALVQMKRTGNLLNELWDLTQQLGQAIDRNDQVSAQMLIAMREEPLGKLQAADHSTIKLIRIIKGNKEFLTTFFPPYFFQSIILTKWTSCFLTILKTSVPYRITYFLCLITIPYLF